MEDDDDDENVNGDIGSPSPPFEGIIKEEAEKQLESQGGGLHNNLENEVIILLITLLLTSIFF